MRTTASVTPFILFSLIVPLSAQNPASDSRYPDGGGTAGPLEQATAFAAGPSAPGMHQVPSLRKAAAELPEPNPVFVAQDASTLDSQLPAGRNVDSVIDLDLLREPSGGRGLKAGLAQISAVYRESGKPEPAADCATVSLAVEQRVNLDPAGILEIVETEIAANPSCACELVKAAIKASDSDVAGVVAIVEAAVLSAPESLRIVAQCAIATVPESLPAVQALLSKLDPNGGDLGDSAKSAKSSKAAKVGDVESADNVAALANPLDFPGRGPVNPGTGTQQRQPLLPLFPPAIVTPPVTPVNP